jgi:YjbE family integral membrane protein
LLENLALQTPSQLIITIISIIILDLVLSGDNAAVIGLAICHLPKKTKKRAAAIGAFFAIALRIICTIFATILLSIPYFSFCGGILLIIITWQLLKPKDNNNKSISVKDSFWKAVGIIVLADFSMAIDNVLAVAGASHGEPVLVIFGLLVSIPILIFASTWLSNLMIKYPIFLWLGGAVLLHTALDMIIEDRAMGMYQILGQLSIVIPIIAAIILLLFGINKIRRQRT